MVRDIKEGMENAGKPLLDKLALVTGCYRNKGRGTALALGDLGADVIVTCVREMEGADRTVAELLDRGVSAATIQVDFDADDAVEPFVEALSARWRAIG